MKQLKKIVAYLFCFCVALNFFPEFWHNTNVRLYSIVDLLPLRVLFVIYLLHTSRFNVYYIVGVTFTIIAGLISNYFHAYYNYAIVVYGFGIVAFIIMAHKDLFKVSTKSIVVFSIPFLVILATSYLYIINDIESVGSWSINFYSLAIGFFLFFAGTLYYNHQSKGNLYFLISAIFIVLTAFFNSFNLVERSFTVERYVNVLFIVHHIYMLLYVLKKENSSLNLINVR